MEKPLNCFTCNHELGRAQLAYEVLLRYGITAREALDALHVRKECCRTVVIGSLDLFDDPANRIYVPAGVELRVANGSVTTDTTPAARTRAAITPRQQPICIRAM